MPKTISYLLEIKGGIAMAYSAQTAHYGLPLPVGSDRSSFLDTNESFTAVDTALYNAVTQNAQTEQEVQDLNAEIVTLQSTVEGYAGDIAGLQNGLASTNLLVQEHASDIANLEGAVSNLVTTKQNVTDENLVTTDKTIVGAINELAGATPQGVDAEDVTYDNTTSGLIATNVQDAIDELATSSLTALWTNNTPSAGMAANTTITLSSSDYDLLLVEFIPNTAGSQLTTKIIIKGHNGSLEAALATGGGTQANCRELTYVSDTEYTAGAGSNSTGAGAAAVATGSAVPTAIYGIKF